MVTRTKKYPIWVTTDMWFADPLPEDEVRRLPKGHLLRTRDKTAAVSSDVHATIEVKVKEGSPLVANFDDVNVSVMFMEDLDDMENHNKLMDFIWDELTKGHTVEMKVIWPSDDGLEKRVEQERETRRWNLERAVAVRSDDLFRKRKKRKR
ncbi:MAG: hypothetical protein IIA05_01610 [Proteobacteria bacterium]|nr:hypothetical protein [Pseudomonadota bacterium]